MRPGFSLLAISLLFSGIFLFTSCLVMENKFSKLPPGVWRATLQLGDPSLPVPSSGEEVPTNDAFSEGELPFLLEVIYENESDFYLEIINGEERIRADQIRFGRDRQRARDTIRIDFPVYDTYITGYFQERVIKGYWVVNYKENYRIPFKAIHGENYRFTQLNKEPVADITGRWKVLFSPVGDAFPAVGEFRQSGNDLGGTFLTETGDYRYLDGTIQGNKFYLSCFDGAHAYLFEGKVLNDSSLIGSFRSGKHYQTTWEATRDPKASLTDPWSLTGVREQAGPFFLGLPTAMGDTVTLDDPRLQGKIKLIQIMGTWCPNCRDETEFLQSLDPELGTVVVPVAFEKYRDPEKAREAVLRFSERYPGEIPVLMGGYSDKAAAGEVFPMLDKIIAFPTLIILDRQNRVRKIHTGFSGPATSEYKRFKTDFTNFLKELAAE